MSMAAATKSEPALAIVVDDDAAIVLNLEHVLGNRLANAVSRALVEVDFYDFVRHGYHSSPTRRTPERA